MDADATVGVVREMMVVLLQIAGPILGTALVVGTLVSILQAATQVNESTLSFLPKLVAVGALLWVMGGWMIGKLGSYSERIFALVAQVGP